MIELAVIVLCVIALAIAMPMSLYLLFRIGDSE